MSDLDQECKHGLTVGTCTICSGKDADTHTQYVATKQNARGLERPSQSRSTAPGIEARG